MSGAVSMDDLVLSFNTLLEMRARLYFYLVGDDVKEPFNTLLEMLPPGCTFYYVGDVEYLSILY